MESDNENNKSLHENDNKVATNSATMKGKGGAIIFFLLSAVFLAIGFYKLLVYDGNPFSPVNAYVGGDAYNYIINSNLATAYFTLAILFTIIALFFLFIGAVRSNNK